MTPPASTNNGGPSHSLHASTACTISYHGFPNTFAGKARRTAAGGVATPLTSRYVSTDTTGRIGRARASLTTAAAHSRSRRCFSIIDDVGSRARRRHSSFSAIYVPASSYRPCQQHSIQRNIIKNIKKKKLEICVNRPLRGNDCWPRKHFSARSRHLG